jgi:hypothetical protein
VYFSIRSENEEAIDALEGIHFTENEKSKNEQVECDAVMIVFFNIRGEIMNEFVLEGRTVNQKYYLEVLTKLGEEVGKKRSDLWKKKSWILQQAIAPANNALEVKQFSSDRCIPVVKHPLYSPDLAPCDLCQFPKVKSALKGTHLSLSIR